MASRSRESNDRPFANRSSIRSSAANVSESRASSRASAAGSAPTAMKELRRTKQNSNTNSIDNGTERNIHVVVRCRGRNDREVKENSGVVVSCTAGQRGRDITIQTGPSAVHNKVYSFDRVFGPESDQNMIYDGVVSPILKEVISGYNCTIFAYGQTGTGKTYTMSGDVSEVMGTYSDEAGIIPRVLYKLFQDLKRLDNDCAVKCSFIELYNEELHDLIAKDEDRKIKLYEDNSKKGVVIQGMEETYIKNANDGIKLLQSGSFRRQVAATKCNDHSSRSHSVFTITVHVKETYEDGEEFMRTGKLNLVDLAGSENITRSGAENKRAREAGMINQSLLTLGRVINALVEHSPHIPYRESKLTRLLQDSLGGRTKTCIIATISPAKVNMDETLSTLEYANRAKNIKNKPQVNQVLNKKTMITEYAGEIERLKSDLQASRNKNGVYVTQESYDQLIQESESRRILAEEKQLKLEVVENQLRSSREQAEQHYNELLDTKRTLETVTTSWENSKAELAKAEKILDGVKRELSNELLISNAYAKTESKLAAIGEELINALKEAVSDVKCLQDTVDYKSQLERKNKGEYEQSKKQLCGLAKALDKYTDIFGGRQQTILNELSEKINEFTSVEGRQADELLIKVQKRMQDFEQQHFQLEQGIDGYSTQISGGLERLGDLKQQVAEDIRVGLDKVNKLAQQLSQSVLVEMVEYQSLIHSSFNDLGKEFKRVFEYTQEHFDLQYSDLQGIQKRVEQSHKELSKTISQNHEITSQSIGNDIEKTQTEGEELIDSIKELVIEFSKRQEVRLTEIASEEAKQSKETILKINNTQEEQAEEFAEWNEAHETLSLELDKNKELIRKTLVETFDEADESAQSLERKTWIVHQETLDFVSSRQKSSSVLMSDFENLVNECQKSSGTFCDENRVLLSKVKSCISEGYKSEVDQLEANSAILARHKDSTVETLTQGKENVGEFLGRHKNESRDLEQVIENQQLIEDSRTGNTRPLRKNYRYTNVLPRTKGRFDILSSQDQDNNDGKEGQQQMKESQLDREPLSSVDNNSLNAHSTKSIITACVDNDGAGNQPTQIPRLSNGNNGVSGIPYLKPVADNNNNNNTIGQRKRSSGDAFFEEKTVQHMPSEGRSSDGSMIARGRLRRK